MATQGPPSIEPAQTNVRENKGDDSDYDNDEDEDEDEEEDSDEDPVAVVTLPPAKNAAGKAKKDRGRQIKPTTPQDKFKLGQFKN